MKEIDLIEEQIISIRNHQGNINSNLGGNLAWKENLEEIVSNTSNISSEFNAALNGMCHVINKIDFLINSVKINKDNLKNLENSDSETTNNRTELIIEKKHDFYNSEPNHLLKKNENKELNCNFIIFYIFCLFFHKKLKDNN
jgi:hypothetical protein